MEDLKPVYTGKKSPLREKIDDLYRVRVKVPLSDFYSLRIKPLIPGKKINTPQPPLKEEAEIPSDSVLTSDLPQEAPKRTSTTKALYELPTADQVGVTQPAPELPLDSPAAEESPVESMDKTPEESLATHDDETPGLQEPESQASEDKKENSVESESPSPDPPPYEEPGPYENIEHADQPKEDFLGKTDKGAADREKMEQMISPMLAPKFTRFDLEKDLIHSPYKPTYYHYKGSSSLFSRIRVFFLNLVEAPMRFFMRFLG